MWQLRREYPVGLIAGNSNQGFGIRKWRFINIDEAGVFRILF